VALRRLGGLLSLAFLLAARSAGAQNDVNPPLPNVLLLVDTSGSMEYKVGSSSYPTCHPDGSQVSEKSRWIELVEVLTGSIQNYRCQSIDRASTSFRNGEYGTDASHLGVVPYDYLYPVPYHRPMSGACVRGPGTLTGNVWAFPDTAFKEHPYDNELSNCVSPFVQATDGILDTFERAIRFGLMTFDPIADPTAAPNTGYTGTSTPAYADGVTGTWSYVVGAPAKGRPVGCLTDVLFEVGARNAAAPPWEGRMVAFGNPKTDEYLTKKEQIKKVLLGSRPYGPTPIAGMLRDAYDFMHVDTSKDPLDATSTQDFGPRQDPYVIDASTSTGCRKRYVILLSDGQPNMDLRPDCGDSVSPDCPFKKPETIALEMKTLARPIQTYVIGFALSQFNVAGRGLVSCNALTDSDFADTPSALCSSADPAHIANTALQACCSLNRIAVAGGTGPSPRAIFADNRDELSSALSQILTKTTAVTSRTQPVIAGAAAGSQGFRFYSSVRPISFQPWVGILQRQRYECVNRVAKAIPVAKNQQDDFAANINEHPDDRYFATIKAGNGSEPIYSGRTIRPYYSISAGSTDGAGQYGGSRFIEQRTSFVSRITPEMIDVTDATCTSPAVNASLCRDRYMKWLVGLPNGTAFNRCNTTTQECYLLGDILHSTPRVVGPPSGFVVDESYARFAAARRKRPLVLYTSTNDGFLHAFKVAPTDPDPSQDKVLGPGTKNNELWAFVPPAILPHLRKQYPFTHQTLLDGAPQVQDVVATEPVDPNDVDSIRFQRTHDEAQKAEGSWRTVLLQSFGTQSPAGGGYFALDVTDPTLDTGTLSSNARGPRFLWQLTTDVAGRPLFGRGGTPAIATLFFDPTGGDAPKEIPVAILPGGGGQPGTVGSGSGCPVTPRSFPAFDRFTPRNKVRCYAAADVPARSLTIARLDTGEIIRTFRQTKAEILDLDLQKLVLTAELDSPIIGQPVAFPSDTASVADRAYVGDQDGRLWKVDLSAAKPENWKMTLLFDAYPATSTDDPGLTHGFNDGQPLVLPPVISVDANGDITVNVATGDQDTATTTINKNYVWSLTEKTSDNRTVSTAHVNWFSPLLDGERVVGPMSLFNSQLFFSTYAPPSAAVSAQYACNSGSSKVWGMDYVRPADKTNFALGGQARLPKPLATGQFVQSLTALTVAGNSNAVIFGVSVAQEPSCTETGTSGTDEFLGYKAERTVTHVAPGKFQLVMHIGGVDNATSSGDLQANVRTIDLQPPPSAARVDSWAALLE
jgi:type IV pilus assembly protein PilY1